MLREEKPGHPANPQPAEGRQGEREDDPRPEFLPRLLRDPGCDRVHQLSVQEHDLEDHDEQFDEDHLNQKLVLPLLDGVREGLDAGKASGNEDEQKHEQRRCGVAWGRLAGDPGEDLRHGRQQDIGEDDCLEQAPADQHQECNPRHAGLKIALCHLPAHLEGKGHRLPNYLHEELQGQAGEG